MPFAENFRVQNSTFSGSSFTVGNINASQSNLSSGITTNGITGPVGPTGPHGNATLGFISVFGGNITISSSNISNLIYNGNKTSMISPDITEIKNIFYLPVKCSLSQIRYSIENVPTTETFLCIIEYSPNTLVLKRKIVNTSGTIDIDPQLLLQGSVYDFEKGIDCLVGFTGDAVGESIVTLYFT
jgi:hypothetical protein